MNYLKHQIDSLEQAGVLLNFLHTRTDLDAVETCEMQIALKGIETLLNVQIERLRERAEWLEHQAAFAPNAAAKLNACDKRLLTGDAAARQGGDNE